jgi:homoserine kinase
VEAARLEPVEGLTPVLCVPARPMLTQTARGLLPASVSHADAAANAARAALLIAGLTADPALLMAGTEDLLHQPYRAAAMPATADLIGRLRDAGIPAVVSGAGPSVLALTVPGIHPGPNAVPPVAGQTGDAWQVRALQVDRGGATVGEPSAGPDQPGGAGL